MKTDEKYTWDLSTLYKSPQDPALQEDIESAIAAYKAFQKTYENNASYLEDAKELKEAIEAYEALAVHEKVHYYLFFYRSINQEDQIARAVEAKTEARMQEAASKIAFFTVSLARLSKKKQDDFLQSSELKEFRVFLERIFRTAQHTYLANRERHVD